MYNQCKGLQQGTNNSVYSFLDELYARLYTPFNVYAWRGMKKEVHASEVWFCYDLINLIQAFAADILPGQIFRLVLNLTSL
jgi:hypothetical protein